MDVFAAVVPGARSIEAYVPIEIQVSSLTTVDLTVTYEMNRGLKIRSGGRNILELTWDMDFGS
ncbi:MAG: hypothetical protein OXH68_08200 [Gammaproteobacteria bacterium]|nr:hypothetical protein [Gammaproteobacteria bacterium]